MSLISEVKHILHDLPLPLTGKSDRKRTAHFCEHHGIFIRFTRARSIWHALAPSAIKPWWLVLQPARARNGSKKNNYTNNNKNNNNKKNVIEVVENA